MITFPRDMPLKHKRRTISFDQERVDAYAPENSGRIGAVQVGWPRWLGVWEYRNLNRGEREELRSWITAQRGPMRMFYGQEGRYSRPRCGGWVPAVVGWSVDETGTVLTIETDNPTQRLSHGDYIGFTWTTDDEPRRFLVRVIEPGVSNGDGEITVTVEPPIPEFVEGSTAVIRSPDCLMRLDPRTQPPTTEFENGRFMTFRIHGVQEILE